MEEKPFSRKITEFKTKRLAADYVLGHLDSKSYSLVTQKLHDDPGFGEKIESLEAAVRYCREISRVRINEDSIGRTLGEISFTNKVSTRQRLISVRNNLIIIGISLILAVSFFQVFLKLYLGKSW